MPLNPCRECGREVSTEATTCPHCGTPNPTPAAASKAKTESGALAGCLAAVVLLPVALWWGFCVQPMASSAERRVAECADGYQPASSRIYPGGEVFYHVDGNEYVSMGTVVQVAGRRLFQDGTVDRAVQFRLSDGSTLWRKRDALMEDAVVVRC